MQNLINPEAEQMLLGALMLKNSALFDVLGTLDADDFYEPLHGQIFDRLRLTVEAGKEANPVTLAPEFAQRLDTLKLGRDYLMKMVRGISLGFANPKQYALVLAELSAKRKMADVLTMFQTRLGGGEPIEVLQCELLAKVSEIGEMCRSMKATSYAEEFLQLAKERSGPSAKTGILPLDSAMQGGLHPGKIYGFAARKKVGKSTLCVTLSRALVKQGCKHVVILGEMGSQEFSERMAAAELDKSTTIFRMENGVPQHMVGELGRLAAEFKDTAFLHDQPNLTFSSMKTILEQAVQTKQGIKGFILDYWQLVGGKGDRVSTSEHQDMVAQWLAGFAKKYHVWGIVMAQLNQDGNTRGSEGMRLAFDQVYKLDRTKREPEGYEAPAWLEMLETRYTPWIDVGSSGYPALRMSRHGTHFDCIK